MTKTTKIIVAIVSLLIITLGVVSFLQNRTINSRDSEIKAYQDSLRKERGAYHTLLDTVRNLVAEKASLQVLKTAAEKEKLDWELKFYKQKLNNEDCKDKVNRAMLNNVPDDEQGSILYDNARRYSTNRQPPG